ncbi:MAG: hypothetical protein MJZ29_03485, partial [Bacteroidaceae bacterium]|nr:hypothetical protein [Bacteroidaceae bacterium]
MRRIQNKLGNNIPFGTNLFNRRLALTFRFAPPTFSSPTDRLPSVQPNGYLRKQIRANNNKF